MSVTTILFDPSVIFLGSCLVAPLAVEFLEINLNVEVVVNYVFHEVHRSLSLSLSLSLCHTHTHTHTGASRGNGASNHVYCYCTSKGGIVQILY